MCRPMMKKGAWCPGAEGETRGLYVCACVRVYVGDTHMCRPMMKEGAWCPGAEGETGGLYNN